VVAHTSAVLEKRARFYFTTVADQLGEDWLHVHEQLLDHVRDQDADAAEALAHRHIEDTGKAVRILLFAGG
jgi:DNA-binding GntR family transcriptional regulator